MNKSFIEQFNDLHTDSNVESLIEFGSLLHKLPILFAEIPVSLCSQ